MAKCRSQSERRLRRDMIKASLSCRRVHTKPSGGLLYVLLASVPMSSLFSAVEGCPQKVLKGYAACATPSNERRQL